MENESVVPRLITSATRIGLALSLIAGLAWYFIPSTETQEQIVLGDALTARYGCQNAKVTDMGGWKKIEGCRGIGK